MKTHVADMPGRTVGARPLRQNPPRPVGFRNAVGETVIDSRLVAGNTLKMELAVFEAFRREIAENDLSGRRRAAEREKSGQQKRETLFCRHRHPFIFIT